MSTTSLKNDQSSHEPVTNEPVTNEEAPGGSGLGLSGQAARAEPSVGRTGRCMNSTQHSSNQRAADRSSHQSRRSSRTKVATGALGTATTVVVAVLVGLVSIAAGTAGLAVRDAKPAHAGTVQTRRQSGVCGIDAQRQFIERLVSRRGVPAPVVESTPGIAYAAQYVVGGVIQVRDRCVSASTLAHETGHYVHLLAMGSFDEALADAEANFSGTWMRNGQYPGLERAAHCIGNVLWGYGPYTRCPVRASWLHANHLVWYAGQPR